MTMVFDRWRRTQVVRERSATPLFTGSNPVGASIGLINFQTILISVHQMTKKNMNWLKSVSSFVSGMTLGGLCVGGVEGIYRDVNLIYATLFYGVFCCGIGLCLGLASKYWPAFVLRKSGGFFSGLALALGFQAFALGYFYAFRDVFQEAADKKALALMIGLGLALTLGLMSLSFSYLWRFFRRDKNDINIAPLFLSIVLLAFIVLLFIGGDDARCVPQKARTLKGRGVIFLVVDTLRADVLGVYGAEAHRGQPPSPNIDAFAAEATTFFRFSAQASWTKPAMATLLSSRHVSGHNTMSKLSTLPDNLPLVATELKKADIVTAAVVTNYNLEAGYGFGRGFDHYTYLSPARYFGAPQKANRLALYNIFRLIRERYLPSLRASQYFYRSADIVNAEGLCLLDEIGDKDFFLWLHYMEPHDPYFSDDGQSYARVEMPHPSLDLAESLKMAYQDEVRRFDHAFGDLAEALKARGLWQNTAVILSADHGEEFGEHGGFYHGVTLYEEQLHLPLIISRPDAEAEEDSIIARQIDVAPTILDFFGLEAPESWEGRTLFDGEREDALAMAEENHQGNILRSIQQAGFKLILSNRDNPRGLPETELFNLVDDPGEMENLKNRVKAAELEDILENAQKEAAKGGRSGTERQMDAAMEAELRSLGYVH